MRGDTHSFGKQHGTGGMEDRVVGTREGIFEEIFLQQRSGRGK